MPNLLFVEKLTPAHYKLLVLAGAGGALEFLDFTIYALFARYLSHNFFPESESLSALLNTFGIFAVGYFARPLGGIVFGYFGDKFGRKNAFTISAFVMAFSTLLMGCLPTYATIGIAAPLLLFLWVVRCLAQRCLLRSIILRIAEAWRLGPFLCL